MNKTLLTIAGLSLVLCAFAEPSKNNMIDNQDKLAPSEQSEAEKEAEALLQGPAKDLITSIYRRAVAKALHDKVSDLQTKLLTGENAIPAAMDILKYALFSNQAKDTIRKATEHVLGIMSPELKKHANDDAFFEPTTPMPKVESKAEPKTEQQS